MTKLRRCWRVCVLAACCALNFGCGSDDDSPGSSAAGWGGGAGGSSAGGGAGGGAGGADGSVKPSSLNWLIVSGGDQGTPRVSSTIEGADYSGGNGIECHLVTLGGSSSLRIDARDGNGGLNSSVLLQYWDFSSYEMERDEDFDPPPPLAETFNMSATIYDGNDLYKYNAPFEFEQYLSQNPSCHTSFSRIDSLVAGKMTCVNLPNAHFNTTADITLDFSCEPSSY